MQQFNSSKINGIDVFYTDDALASLASMACEVLMHITQNKLFKLYLINLVEQYGGGHFCIIMLKAFVVLKLMNQFW